MRLTKLFYTLHATRYTLHATRYTLHAVCCLCSSIYFCYTKTMKLNVPYYSQFVDLQDPFWMLRACGMTSLVMVAEFEGITNLSILTLCQEAKERGGYDMVNGWIHDYLVMKAQELGLHACRKEGIVGVEELIAHLIAGHPVIVSVEKRVLEQKRFHLLVLTGYDTATNSFFYHEPESTDKERGTHRRVDVATFLEYFRGKAIFVEK